jgi:hypothetical protein
VEPNDVRKDEAGRAKLSTRALGGAVVAAAVMAPAAFPMDAGAHVGSQYCTGKHSASARCWGPWQPASYGRVSVNSAQNLSHKTACVQLEWAPTVGQHSPHYFGPYACKGMGNTVVSHGNASWWGGSERPLCWNGAAAGYTTLHCWYAKSISGI